MRKKWAKEFRWRSRQKLPDGSQVVSLKEANEMLSRAVAVGDCLALEMMRQMLMGLSDPQFCRTQNAWNQFLQSHKSPSDLGLDPDLLPSDTTSTPQALGASLNTEPAELERRRQSTLT